MLRPAYWKLSFLVAMLPGLISCGNRSNIPEGALPDVDLNVERFDLEIFGMHPDSVESSVPDLYAVYGDFFDVYNTHIIQIGPASERHYATYLRMFINDPTNREVSDTTARVFADMDDINREISDGFSRYLYHFPDSGLPRVVAYVSRFNQGLFTVDDFIGVGLDQYLGEDCEFYRLMAIPRYLVRNKLPERIPQDVMMAWASSRFPYNDSVDHVLNRMIHKGMLRYFVQAMYPELSEAVLFGFTADQMEWCKNNELQMWTYLVEHKLLFESDPMTIRKLTEDAPYTSFFTTESPGRAANWQGMQILKEFMDRNRDISLRELMAMRDYQEILRLSRYDP